MGGWVGQLGWVGGLAGPEAAPEGPPAPPPPPLLSKGLGGGGEPLLGDSPSRVQSGERAGDFVHRPNLLHELPGTQSPAARGTFSSHSHNLRLQSHNPKVKRKKKGGVGLAYACNMCSMVHAAREQGPVQTRRPPVSALLPPEPEPGLCWDKGGGVTITASHSAGYC